MSADDPEQTLKGSDHRGSDQALVSGSLQSFINTSNKVVLMEWLAKEANRTGLHGSCPHAIIRIASHENNGYAVTSGDKAVLQVNAVQPRHLHIGDKARCVVNLLGFEKFIARAKCGSVVVERLHELFRRIAHGFIVIDNRNQYLRHSVLRASRFGGSAGVSLSH